MAGGGGGGGGVVEVVAGGGGGGGGVEEVVGMTFFGLVVAIGGLTHLVRVCLMTTVESGVEVVGRLPSVTVT